MSLSFGSIERGEYISEPEIGSPQLLLFQKVEKENVRLRKKKKKSVSANGSSFAKTEIASM